MNKLVGKILCKLGFHDKEYVKPPPGYMGGIMAPMRCKRGCGWEHKGFKYPEPPPMPKVFPPAPPPPKVHHQVCSLCGK
jgi:hypothetical protein